MQVRSAAKDSEVVGLEAATMRPLGHSNDSPMICCLTCGQYGVKMVKGG